MVQKPWTPEREVSMSLARGLVSRQFPELASPAIKALGTGWDNAAYLINEEWVFRFPQREIAVQAIQREINYLEHLQGRLPLAIPCPTYIGKSSDTYPWPFYGYPLLKGNTACQARLPRSQKAKLAKTIASFLKSLHQQSVSIAQEKALPGDIFRRSHIEERRTITLDLFKELKREKLWNGSSPILSFLKNSLQEPQSPIRVVHGDFYLRHLILNSELSLSGIIDWGDVHTGKAWIDLSIAHSYLPPECHGEFRNHYGEISEAEWNGAKLLGAFFNAVMLKYGRDTNNLRLEEEAKIGLTFLEETLSIK